MILIAFDDTDSRDGMCTTYLMALFLKLIAEEDIDVIGYPSLVRLNPNIPYKTRGNGALCVRLGSRGQYSDNSKFEIMEWDGTKYFAYDDVHHEHQEISDEMELDIGKKAFNIACKVIADHAHLDSPGTEPGIVMFHDPPDGDFYHRALHDLVEISDAADYIKQNNGITCTFKSGRGIIGAAAACAWTYAMASAFPHKDHTFEIICYRVPSQFGKPRMIDTGSVMEMDGAYPGTFDNYDYHNRHLAIAPSSPCPVLFGIRGESYDDLPIAARMVQGEDYRGYVIFRTNQGTDDHLIQKDIQQVKPYESVMVSGTITRDPMTIPGGHVVTTLQDATGSIDCIAYEPTKEFRDIIREFVPGDRITVCGGVRKMPLTVNIEKLRIDFLVQRERKLSNPACPDCGKSMKSIGTGQGYRCRTCGTKAGEGDVLHEEFRTALETSWYEVPVCARRHLAKPLKLFSTRDL